jgi:Domain of unknown function (DUF6378)
MTYSDILKDTAKIIMDRGSAYGKPEDTIARCASLASLKLNKPVSPYEVAVIMESMKDARRAVQPDNSDHHIDGLAYRAFAAGLRNDRLSDDLALSVNDLREAVKPSLSQPLKSSPMPGNGSVS